jgi:hypothetical protein
VRERVRVVLRAVRATRAGAVYGDADGTVRTRWIRARTALFTMCRGARRAWRVECGSVHPHRTGPYVWCVVASHPWCCAGLSPPPRAVPGSGRSAVYKRRTSNHDVARILYWCILQYIAHASRRAVDRGRRVELERLATARSSKLNDSVQNTAVPSWSRCLECIL